jgi:hypothetical protein
MGEPILSWPTAVDLTLRAYDALAKRGAPLQSDAFVEYYSTSLRYALAVLPKIDTLDANELDKGLRAVLAALSSVVHAYHLRSEDVAIRTNLMVPLAPSPDLVQRSRFCERDTRRHDSYAAFLDLRMWDWKDDRQPTGVLLPVEQPSRHHCCLPGAPKAYLSGRFEHVHDTLEPGLWSTCESDSIRRELAQYFHDHRDMMKSFVSYPVHHPLHGMEARPIAVVNVQSSAGHVLGRFKGNWRKLSLLLEPLLVISSYYVARLYSAPADGTLAGPAHV